jgi:hypothetical protein
MMTPTHVLIGSGLLSRRNSTAVNWAAALGGLMPDVPMFVLFAWDRFVMGLPEGAIWDGRYDTDAWQIPAGLSHSFPLYAAILAVGLFWRQAVVIAYSAASLLHAGVDFLVHHEDAHMQFLPFSRWKFISPVSYYDPQHYGNIASKIELAIAISMIVPLWRRFPSLWVRVACGVALAVFVAVPLYFSLTMDHDHPH